MIRGLQQLARTLDRPVARWLLVLGWMALLFALSAQPQVQVPHLESALLDRVVKKIGHFLEYGVLALLLWRALDGPRAWLPAWGIAVLYAVSDEWHQTFVTGRGASPWDVLIDAGGAAAALLIVWRLTWAGRRAEMAGAKRGLHNLKISESAEDR